MTYHSNRGNHNVVPLRTVPHSLEAEQCVLGGLMLDNDAWPQIARILTEEDFYPTHHRLIYRAIAELAGHQQPFDVITLGETLDAQGALTAAGGLPYLGTLVRDTPSAANVAVYAGIVHEKAFQRRLLEAAQRHAVEEVRALLKAYDEQSRTALFVPEQAFVNDWLDMTSPPRHWLFQDLLPCGKTGLLVAPGGTGKSQLALQIGISVATGLPLCGWWWVGEPGAALLLFAEDDDEELHRRLQSAVGALAADPGSGDFQTALRRRLFIKSMVGRDNLITARLDGEVRRTGYADALIATARQIPDLKLILLDPASRFKGGDENAAADATRFVEALEYLVRETHAAVLVVHHANKASLNGNGASQTAARGSSALTDGVRWQMNLATMTPDEAERYGVEVKERGYYVKVAVPKNNYAPPTGEVWLRRGPGGFLSVTRLTRMQDTEDQMLLEKVTALIEEHARRGLEYSKRAFRDTFSGVSSELGCGEKRVRQVIERGLASGALLLRPPLRPQRNVDEVLAVPPRQCSTKGA